jgi:hypothetical protein
VGISDLHQPVHLLYRVLSRLLRDRFHHLADDSAGRAEAAGTRGWRRCCPDLVRRHALREHANIVPASSFGFALFYLRGVAPKEIKSSDIYWGAMPWMVCKSWLRSSSRFP